MDFVKATDALFLQLTTEDLAKEMGLAPQTIRKARVTKTSVAARNPPAGWEKAAAKLASRQAAHFTKLAAQLRASE
jgi:hypothetical protein